MQTLAHRAAILAAVALSTAAVAGCGLVGEEKLAAKAPVAGVSPYQDLGTVQICLAQHRLGPAGSSLAGFCVPRTAPQPSFCGFDGDCQSRESCVCGVCTVKYCSRNDECRAGQICDFSQNKCVDTCDDDCDCAGANSRCEIGTCNQLCLVTAECQAGEICSRSRARCVTAPCASDADCFTDEECRIQREPRQVAEPAPIVDGGQTVIYLDMLHAPPFERERHMIFRAVVQDGRRWQIEPAAPVLMPAIADDYRAPSVVRGPSGLIMYVELGDGAGIVRATSSDGRNWTIDPAPVLLPAEAWESGHVSSPSAVVGPDGYIWLYYEAGNGMSIGLAIATDAAGAQFPGLGGRTEVLTRADVEHDVLWRGVTRLRAPHVLLGENFEGEPYFRLYFSARGFESSLANSFGTIEQIPANYSIGYAASNDGVVFKVYPYNPIFDRILPNSFVNHASEMTPAVLESGETFQLIFAAADRNLATWENLRLAVNPPPVVAPERKSRRSRRSLKCRK